MDINEENNKIEKKNLFDDEEINKIEKKNLFGDEEINTEELKTAFNYDLKKKHDLFTSQNGRVLFELHKTFKGDKRFQLDERFLDDIEEKKLPESILLNYKYDEQIHIKKFSKKKEEIAEKEKNSNNSLIKEYGVITNDDELWKEKEKYYKILEKVCNSEIRRPKKIIKHIQMRKYDPTKLNSKDLLVKVKKIEKVKKIDPSDFLNGKRMTKKQKRILKRKMEKKNFFEKKILKKKKIVKVNYGLLKSMKDGGDEGFAMFG